MAREVLPVHDCLTGLHFSAPLPWWRKALVRTGQRLIKWGNPPNMTFNIGGRPAVNAVDLTRLNSSAKTYECGFYRGPPEIPTANPFEDKP